MSDQPLRRLDASAADDADDRIPGTLIAGRYRVVERVARGGMARIYRARDERLDRDVALKILSRPYADDPAYVERFLSEARNAASISHPNLVHVYDSGSDGDLHYIAMELLPTHRSLRELIRTNGRLPPRRAVAIALDILAGLRAAHGRGLVHCDVKSANVMVQDGSTKLIDFGIARSRSDERPEGSSIGSLHYMAPEQLLGERLTPATDLYSVGVLLYEALTGRVPFQGETPDQVAAAHVAGNPVPPREINREISYGIESVVLRALRREPERRFPSADAMIDALRSADAGDDRTQPLRAVAPPPQPYRPPAVPAEHVPPPRRAPPQPLPASTPRRPRRGVPWGAIALLAAVAGLAAIVWIGVSASATFPGGGGVPAGSASAPPAAATAGPSVPAGQVRVPDVVGLSEEEAIARANAAQLVWTLNWRTDPNAPVGVYAQDLEPDTLVDVGTEFNIYSNRH